MTPTINRRSFLFAQHQTYSRPPWTNERALASCTGCAACVEACPSGLLKIEGAKPVIAFTSECTFCGACAESCPEHLFARDSRPFQHVVSVTEGCLARLGVVCQSCRDACPEAAIRFTPRRGGPFLPEVRDDACTGCGACLSICPTRAIEVTERIEVVNA